METHANVIGWKPIYPLHKILDGNTSIYCTRYWMETHLPHTILYETHLTRFGANTKFLLCDMLIWLLSIFVISITCAQLHELHSCMPTTTILGTPAALGFNQGMDSFTVPVIAFNSEAHFQITII
jgi:hypothetical protein